MEMTVFGRILSGLFYAAVMYLIWKNTPPSFYRTVFFLVVGGMVIFFLTRKTIIMV